MPSSTASPPRRPRQGCYHQGRGPRPSYRVDVSSDAPQDRSEDQPCPSWCVTGADHLTALMRVGIDDFWHQGVEHDHPTMDRNHNWVPQDITVQLIQQEHVGERGTQHHSTQVDCGGYTLSPDQARALAATLLLLAAVADGPTQ